MQTDPVDPLLLPQIESLKEDTSSGLGQQPPVSDPAQPDSGGKMKVKFPKPKSSLIITIITIGILVGGLAAGVYLSQKRQELRRYAAGIPCSSSEGSESCKGESTGYECLSNPYSICMDNETVDANGVAICVCDTVSVSLTPTPIYGVWNYVGDKNGTFNPNPGTTVQDVSISKFEPANWFLQCVWQGDKGYCRNVPVINTQDPNDGNNGKPDWANAEVWKFIGDKDNEVMPNPGNSVQDVTLFEYDDGFIQYLWQGGKRYTRTIKKNSDGTPAWPAPPSLTLTPTGQSPTSSVTVSPTVSPISTNTPTSTPICTPYELQDASLGSEVVRSGGTLLISCNWGAIIDCGAPVYKNSNNNYIWPTPTCTWNGYDTSNNANYSCNAPVPTGQYTLACETRSGSSSECCASKQDSDITFEVVTNQMSMVLGDSTWAGWVEVASESSQFIMPNPGGEVQDESINKYWSANYVIHTMWQGDKGYFRKVYLNDDGSPNWPTADEMAECGTADPRPEYCWNTNPSSKNDESLPNPGETVQDVTLTEYNGGFIQTMWQGDKGYSRILDKKFDGSPNWPSAPISPTETGILSPTISPAVECNAYVPINPTNVYVSSQSVVAGQDLTITFTMNKYNGLNVNCVAPQFKNVTTGEIIETCDWDNYYESDAKWNCSAPEEEGEYKIISHSWQDWQDSDSMNCCPSDTDTGKSITVSSGGTVSPPPENTADLTLYLRMQGSLSEDEDGNLIPVEDVPVTLSFVKDEAVVATKSATGSANEYGMFTVNTTGIEPDTYDIYIKGWAHIQRGVSSITLQEGENELDLTQILLLAGDVSGGADSETGARLPLDDKIDALDVTLAIAHYEPDTPEEGSPADINRDGTVNAIDLGFILQNYLMEGQAVP